MKTLKQIGLIALAVVFIATVISFAETARLGSTLPKSFNPTREVTKTAAYTLTTSDSLVRFTTSSANIVATLPSVTDALAGMRVRYKILKTDATTYKVIVTPATGDTIGGESTRYLLSQNDYMIISAGPGKNWTVEYESPYIVEDHEAGTYTTGIGSGGAYSAETTSRTLTVSDCGKTLGTATDTMQWTLPAVASSANCFMRFVNTGAAGAALVDVKAADGGFFGTIDTNGGTGGSHTIISSGTTSAMSNTKTTAQKGDSLEIYGTGSIWVVSKTTGTWTTK